MAVEPSADLMDQSACAEIRDILNYHGVPEAPFIDDHVKNAIRQRNKARELLRRIDAVITWETTPLGRGFQEEIEAALK